MADKEEEESGGGGSSTEVSCEGCNSCEICDSCEVDCEDCQSFCETGGQNSSNGFSYSKCIAAGQTITPDNSGFTLSDWNSAINRINSVFSEGGQSDASYATIGTFSGRYLTASEFKRVANAAGYTSDNGVIQPNSLIKGSYFSSLQNAVANLNYKWNQCDTCNAGCDGGCNECMSCDAKCEAEVEYCCHCDDKPEEEGGEGD